jgi:hypothetical protein
MKKTNLALIFILLSGMLFLTPYCYGLQFSLIPANGDPILASPGDTVTWDYTIYNDDTYTYHDNSTNLFNPWVEAYTLPNDKQLSDLIVNGSIDILFDFPENIAPGATATGTFMSFTWQSIGVQDCTILGFAHLDIYGLNDDGAIAGGIDSFNSSIVSVPEPNSIFLLLAGIISGFLLSLKISNFKS